MSGKVESGWFLGRANQPGLLLPLGHKTLNYFSLSVRIVREFGFKVRL